jgi:hypothetical protein
VSHHPGAVRFMGSAGVHAALPPMPRSGDPVVCGQVLEPETKREEERRVADDAAALGEQPLNVAEAALEPAGEPDGLADHLGREALAAIERP